MTCTKPIEKTPKCFLFQKMASEEFRNDSWCVWWASSLFRCRNMEGDLTKTGPKFRLKYALNVIEKGPEIYS